MSDSTRDIREERRWVRYVLEWGGRSPFVHAPLYTKSRAEAELDRCEVALPICRTDLGESILPPGQVAVSRGLLARIYREAECYETGDIARAHLVGIRSLVRPLLTSPAADQPKPEVLVPAKGPVAYPKYTIHETEHGGLTTRPADQPKPGSDPLGPESQLDTISTVRDVTGSDPARGEAGDV